ncbi:hypothetical protein HPB51_004360 [Rhipicephalus microplus]|uniref:Amino acid transporter n=1 Tax=Rhipicephalus microplus TaxID=6941 RepID=A0A9J6ELG8_RHIMP|nr:hypothetical protein HPB51_004360 [Rhipicephalus microplus]
MFTSLDNANLMGVLCFSVILGLVLSAFRDEQNVVLHVFVCLSNTLMTATHMLLWFAPVGLCSASVSLVLQGAAELQVRFTRLIAGPPLYSKDKMNLLSL